MKKNKLVLILSMILSCTKSDISDENYLLMPELFFLDNFDQCMLLEAKTQFCLFTFMLKPIQNSNKVWDIIQNVSSNPQNYRHDRLRHGICVPTTCAHYYYKNRSLQESIENCYNNKFSRLELKGSISDLSCESNVSRYNVDTYDITVVVISFLYIAFVTFASFYGRISAQQDEKALHPKPANKVALFVTAFSIPRNWYRLTHIKPNSTFRKLRSIQGMRFYNMICVIMSHTVMSNLAGPLSNPQYSENSTKKVLNMCLANGWFVVQTFFVISGWLLSYHFFEMMDKSKEFKRKYLIYAVLNRYLRLAPALAVMVAIHSTWLVHLSRGPSWDMFVGEEYRNCRTNWWTNILFINNFVQKNSMCLQQTWYVASDMQLFIFSLMVLTLVVKYPKRRWLIFGIVLVTGFFVPGILAYVNEYDIIVRQYPEVLYNLQLLKLEHWHVLYSSSYSNIFGYTIGIVFGYIFFKHHNQNLVTRKIYVLLWWILTFGMCIFVVLMAAVFYNPNFTYTAIESGLYWSFGKNLFALGIAIGIFGFSQKIGWFARWFCEWQQVQVLGRLTYSTYLIHVAIIKTQMGYRRYPVSANDTIMFVAVLGDVVCAYLGGTVLCLLVEMPISALQKVLWSRNGNPKMTKTSSEKSLKTFHLTCDEKKHETCTKV